MGGLVRNALLGLAPSDIDVCGPALPEQAAEACRACGIAVIEKAAALGTLELHWDGLSVEYTAFRSESYGRSGAHRPDEVQFGASLAADAARRDFTVNALYADLETGEVIDPTGGLADLAAGRLRATHENADEILGADALRVLRLVRFAAELGFSVEPGTWDAARRNAHRLADIAFERRRDELVRILLCDGKYPELPQSAARTPLCALTALEGLGALEQLIPELAEGRGMAQRSDYHRYDVLDHAFHTCAETPPDLTLRLAGLLHDIGKPASLRAQGNFHAHSAIGAEMAEAVLTRLRVPARTVREVSALIAEHMVDLDGRAAERTLRRRFVQWGEQRTRQLILLREADIRGSGIEAGYRCGKWRSLLARMLAEGVPFSEEQLALDGNAVMALTSLRPGPGIGQIKRKLFLHVAAHPEDNTPQRLAAIVRDIAGRGCQAEGRDGMMEQSEKEGSPCF